MVWRPMRSHRSLRTILFTDLVGSTERATDLGDKTWHELLQRHHVTVRQTLRHWGAREVSEAGDGFLAILNSPARGIACAAAIREIVRSLGLEVRCGVHLGDANGRYLLQELDEAGRSTRVVAASPYPTYRSPWWRQPESNRRPSACKADALPTELCPHRGDLEV